MGYGFAGGVKDPGGQHGFVTVGPRDVCAVNLTSGQVLWVKHDIGRPLAATERRLLLLDGQQKSYVLRFLDASTGADVGRVEQFGMPDWAEVAGIGSDAVTIEAQDTTDADQVRISWRIWRPYRGGAPPSGQVQAQASDVRSGAIVVDMAKAEVSSDSSAPPPKEAAIADPPPAERDLGPFAASAPDVLALERVQDRLFTLKAQRGVSGEACIALEARDALDGTPLWEVPLVQRPASETSPTPPRPSAPVRREN
jgi:hypothetical protein